MQILLGAVYLPLPPQSLTRLHSKEPAVNDTIACIVCHQGLYENELGRQACLPCERRTDENLRLLAGPEGLYARLRVSLAPGAGGGGPAVSGSRSAPLPLRLQPLSLMARGGVVTILQTWLVDWHEVNGWRHPRWQGDLQQQLDQAVGKLRANLPWAASSHEAFAEFAAETASIRRQCERQVTGERPERSVPVACPCGRTLWITLTSQGRLCRCGTQYSWAELRDLPFAGQRAA